MWDLPLLLLGLLGLWGGTEIALQTTLELAERHGLSHAFLGLTVLAVGTDLPELLVAVDGGFHRLAGTPTSGVVVGNAVGSAILQGSLVLGVAGLVSHLRLAPHLLRRDGATLMLAILLLGLVAGDGRVEWFEGASLLAVYAVYSIALVQAERASEKLSGGPGRRLLVTGAGIVLGLGTVIGSAELVVGRSLVLAEEWGVSQTLIGILLVGTGTSLPELALSLGAAAKGRAGLSVGNVVGSNIFDILVPIGASSVISPLEVERWTLRLDLPALVAITLLALLFFRRRRGIHRPQALALILVFLAYALLRVAV